MLLRTSAKGKLGRGRPRLKLCSSREDGIDRTGADSYLTSMRLKKTLAKLVAFERVCHVATTGTSGMPHVVPVCHVLDDGKLYFASEGGAKKVAHLRANPRAAITVDFYAEDWSNLKGV